MDTPHESASETTLRPKADLARRFLAFLIDSIIAGVAGVLFGIIAPLLGTIASAGYIIFRDGVDLEFMDRRSIGKRLLNLRPYRLDGLPMDLETSLRRNWMFGLGSLAQLGFAFGLGAVISLVGTLIAIYEIYRVVTDPAGRRWGDELAHTMVSDSEA